MKITRHWLTRHKACSPGIAWWEKQNETDAVTLVERLITEEIFSRANWTLTRLFTDKQNLSYAIFAAELVLHIYEEANPGDDRPRRAIMAARAYLDEPTDENKKASVAAAESAWSAAWSASKPGSSSAKSAAWSAGFAESAEYSRYAAWYAESAAGYAESTAMKTIVEHGLEILREVSNEQQVS